jgi:hypothetical protein
MPRVCRWRINSGYWNVELLNLEHLNGRAGSTALFVGLSEVVADDSFLDIFQGA